MSRKVPRFSISNDRQCRWLTTLRSAQGSRLCFFFTFHVKNKAITVRAEKSSLIELDNGEATIARHGNVNVSQFYMGTIYMEERDIHCPMPLHPSPPLPLGKLSTSSVAERFAARLISLRDTQVSTRSRRHFLRAAIYEIKRPRPRKGDEEKRRGAFFAKKLNSVQIRAPKRS